MKIIKNGSVNAEEESSNKIMENNKEFKNKDHYEDNMICEENSDDLVPDVMEIDKEKTSLRTNLT